MKFRPREELVGLAPTVHGGQGWKLGNIEDYSQNLNPLGPPEWLHEVLEDISDFGHYPDADCTELKGTIQSFHGRSPAEVVMGAGSSEIIRNFPFAFLNKGDRVVIPRPSFAEYSQQIILAGGTVDYMDLKQENGFHLDVEELKAKVSGKDCKALYICNPNNPTGRVESRKLLGEVAEICSDNGTMMFLDETLLELVAGGNDISMIPCLDKHDNLIVTRSFTKSFAVPGIRVGYAISSPEIAAEMEKVRLPWNIGTFEQKVAAMMMNDMEYVRNTAVLLKQESMRMHDQIVNGDIDIGPVSESFFYFVDCGRFGTSSDAFRKGMLDRGFAVRDCTSFGFPSYVRFCVKDHKRDDEFIMAMMQAVEGK